MVQATQDRDGHDLRCRTHQRRWPRRTGDRLPEPLVRSRRIEVLTVLAQRAAQLARVQDQQVVEALAPHAVWFSYLVTPACFSTS